MSLRKYRLEGFEAFAEALGWPWEEFQELSTTYVFALAREYGVRLSLVDKHRPKRWPDVLLCEGWPDTWPRRSNA